MLGVTFLVQGATDLSNIYLDADDSCRYFNALWKVRELWTCAGSTGPRH